jgi:hypothetical protein
MGAPSIEQQLRDWIGQLAPEHKHMLLLMLAEDDRLLRAARLDFAEVQLRRLTGARNLNWDEMSESERESFLNELIQEEEIYATQVGTSTAGSRPTCYHCGHELLPSDLYRVYFGERAPKAEPTSAMLVVLDVEAGNAQFPVAPTGETVIGRLDPHRGIRPAIDLSRFDPAARVSRRHARILVRGNQYLIEDLGSANGTIINGRVRLKPQKPIQLTDGDLVKVGETTLKFVG